MPANEVKKKISVGDLFSGIGGFSLGLEWTGGFETKWFVEIDDFCNKVLEKHWPNVKRYRDVKEVGKHNLEPVDLICGGFPCQDISIAGRKGGIGKERSGLWSEMWRVLGEIRPKYALVENVPNLIRGDNGRWMGRVLGDLAQIGFDAEWHCIPVAALGGHFYGERIFIFANSTKAGLLRLQGKWKTEMGKNPWRLDEFERLVQLEIQLSIPAGKNNRISDGLPQRVDRLKSLGNAVVPQIPYIIGKAIMEIEASERA